MFAVRGGFAGGGAPRSQQSLQPLQVHLQSGRQLHFSPGQHFIPHVPSID
jgi:hypothetical protein